MLDTVEPSGKIMRPILPDDKSLVLISKLLFTPLVPALTVFNNSTPELVMRLPNPIVPVNPLTDTAYPVVDPAPDTRYRSPALPHDYDPTVKEESPPGAG